MRSFTNLGIGFYAAVGPKGRTDRMYVVKYDDGTFDVLNVNQALRSSLTKVIAGGAVCRTPSGQERSMTVIGSKDFDVIGEHHFGVTRTLPDHISHMVTATADSRTAANRADCEAAIKFFITLGEATDTQAA